MTPRQFKSLLIHNLSSWLAWKYALCVYGKTGIGKTSIPRSFALEGVKINGTMTKIPVVVFNATALEPTDLTGLPFRDGELTRYLTPEMLAMCEDPENGVRKLLSAYPRSIVIIDEITRLEYQVRNAVMQLLDERRIGSFHLPKGCQLICTANPPAEGYQVSELDKALMRRTVILDMHEDIEEWREWGTTHDILPGILASVGRIKAVPTTHIDGALKQGYCFAGVTMASDLLRAGLENIFPGAEGEAFTMEVLAGAVGSQAAAVFMKGLSDKKLKQMLDCLLAGDQLSNVKSDEYLEVAWLFVASAIKDEKFVWAEGAPKTDEDGNPAQNPMTRAAYLIYAGAPVDIRPMLVRQMQGAITSATQDPFIQKLIQEFGAWTKTIIRRTDGGKSSKK